MAAELPDKEIHMKTIAFIGCGNMGGAIMGGILAKGYADADHIIAADLNQEQLVRP